jgi:hypothetical protein
MDYYGGSDVGIQVDVISGTPNWTVQQTLQNPNDTSVTPVWYDHPDTNMVGQTVGRQSNYGFCPAAVRIVINSGDGTVRMTLLQHGAPGDR